MSTELRGILSKKVEELTDVDIDHLVDHYRALRAQYASEVPLIKEKKPPKEKKERKPRAKKSKTPEQPDLI